MAEEDMRPVLNDGERVETLPIRFDLSGKPFDYNKTMILVPMCKQAAYEVISRHRSRKKKTCKCLFQTKNPVNNKKIVPGYVVDEKMFAELNHNPRQFLGFCITGEREVFLVDGNQRIKVS